MAIRLFLVEDDPAISRMLEASLSRYGFEITAYDDGQKAVDEYEPRKFDVALIDVSLPGKDGFEVAMAVRSSPGGNQLGVVMMSAHAQGPDVVLQMRRAQVDAWMNKPLSLRDLRDKLAELADRYTGASSELLRTGASTRRSLRVPTTPREVKEPGPQAPPVDPQEIKPKAPTPDVPTSAPTPAPSAAPAPPEIRLEAKPEVLGTERVSIGGHADVPRAMLDAARQRRTGVLLLKHREAEAKVAYISGVMVGASENSHDHRLLTRLVRRGVLELEDVTAVRTYAHEHRLRVAEAVLALERCDAEVLLDELEQQASDRLTLAAGWTAGEMWFDEGKEQVERLAISSFDAFEVILRRFDRYDDPGRVTAWIEQRGLEAVRTSKDFEDGLVGYARVAPDSPLPGVLFMNLPNLEGIAGAVKKGAGPDAQRLLSHVYGMWIAGLLRLADDPPMDERPVPRPVRSDDVESVVPEKEVVAAVRAEWLRAQGRSFYDVLGVKRSAPETELWEAIGVYTETWGRDALSGRRLGPVEGLAEELWAVVDDLSSTLADPEMRAAYDEMLGPPDPAEAEPHATLAEIDADTSYLAGRIALQSGDLAQARRCFEEAASFDAGNVEYKSHLAWIDFLEAADKIDGVLAKLKEAAHDHPKSMRPLLLLGLAAERLGFPAAARDPLQDALHRCPDDQEVMSAILRVEKALGGG